MRRRIQVARFEWAARALIAIWLAGAQPAPASAVAAEPPGAADQDSADGAGRWLPVPEEDLESVEALDEERPSGRTSALLRGAVARGRFVLRRIGLVGLRRGLRCELGFLADEAHIRPGIRFGAEDGGWAVAAGRVTVSRAPPLFAEAMRITRTGRRVSGPRSGIIAVAPSLGASSGAIDGGAVILRGGVSAWSFAGTRGDSREPVAGLELGVARGGTRLAIAAGVAGAARCGSITVVRRDRGRSMALEALRSSRGRAVLAEAASRGNAMLLRSRWRYYSWAARTVAAELSAETLGPGPRARLEWRSWSADAATDDGLLELEATTARFGRMGPVRARLGAVGIGSGNHAPASEAYGMIDGTLARDTQKSLSVHAVRRAASRVRARASSTTVGARVDVHAGRAGEHSVMLEATRVRAGASAWSVDLTPSGETILRSRSKPGMRLAARGGFGARRFRFGYALERSEDAEGPRPWSGTLWLRLDR